MTKDVGPWTYRGSFQDKVHRWMDEGGREVYIRDQYENPVGLDVPEDERYTVWIDDHSFGGELPPELREYGVFPDIDEAYDFAVNEVLSEYDDRD